MALNLLVCPRIPYILPTSDKERHYSDDDLLAMLQSINRDAVKKAEFIERNDGDDYDDTMLRDAIEKESVEILRLPLQQQWRYKTVKDLFLDEFSYFDENAFQVRYYDDTILQQILNFMNQTVNLRELFVDYLYNKFYCEWKFNALTHDKKDALAAVIRSGKAESFGESDSKLRDAFIMFCIYWNTYNAEDECAKSISDYCAKPLDKAKEQVKSLREQAALLMKQAQQLEKQALENFLRDTGLDGKVMYCKRSGKVLVKEENEQNALYFEPDERDRNFEFCCSTISKGANVLDYHFSLSVFVREAAPLKGE